MTEPVGLGGEVRQSAYRKLAERAHNARQNSRLRRLAWFMAALLIVLGGLDVVSTGAALAAGNEEANPLMVSLQINLGSWWGLPKVFIHLLFAYFVVWLPTRRMMRAATIVSLFYGVVIISNFTLAY